MATPVGSAAGAYAAAKNLMAGGAGGVAAPVTSAGGPGAGFGDLLRSAMDGAGETGRRAEQAAMSAASGRADLVNVVTAVAESETALQTLVAVRDRVISAYEEIMRMQI